MECHSDSTLEKALSDSVSKSMFVHIEVFKKSSHADMDCIGCHTDLENVEDYPHAENLQKVDCGVCHEDIMSEYVESHHGKSLKTGNPLAPTCAGCHSAHNILPKSNPASTTHALNLPNTCAVCHSQYNIASDPDVRIANSFALYKAGVHGMGIAKGVNVAASCNDCHAVHSGGEANEETSLVNRKNIPKTCAKCHSDFYYQYMNSIHGKALTVGVMGTAICTDCHGEHKILDRDNPESPIHTFNVAAMCSKCHEDDQINEKYGLPQQRLVSYNDSYHGWAIRAGSRNTATCVSCHNAHEILPSTNPRSSIHPDNLARTCQRCHFDASDNFAASYTHSINVGGLQKSGVRQANDIITTVYIVFIIMVIGGMLIHNLIILTKHVRDRYHEQKKQEIIIRFTTGEVLQHLRLAISFTVLVITGFALRFPESWWVDILSFLGINETVRGVIHRAAAVLFLYTILQHMGYLFFTRRGKQYLKDMLPLKSDFQEFFQNMRYHLGFTTEEPRYGRFDYTQKAEYWALVWGGFLMTLTGFVLWFPALFTDFMPAWVINISETVHYYEAWLAMLAIIFFHFFMVMGHPEEYPMNISFITGKLTDEVARKHYPRWYQKVKEEGALPKKTDNRKSMIKDIIDPDDRPVN
jgi:formate dehydrogenase gamma subunit